MLRWTDDSSRRTRELTTGPPSPRGAAPRRAPAPAAGRRRPDPDRPRRRPLLEGVHLPDRAREDAPDARRRSSGSRCGSASTPASSRAASPPTSAPRPRRSSPAPTRCSRSARFDESIEEYARALPAVLGTGAVELHVRALNGEAMAHAQNGDVKRALALLGEARGLVEREEFSDIDRAEVLYRLGVCRYKLSSIATAVALLQRGARARRALGSSLRRAAAERLRVALALLPPPARLRGRARGRRARARARRGAARRARARRRRTSRPRCSPSATATGCSPAPTPRRRRRTTRSSPTAANVGRLLNNLGGLDFLLGKPEQAIEHLKQAFAVALEVDRDEDAATRRLVARPGASAHRRRRARRGAGAARARAHRRPRRHARRDRQRAARARARAARAGPARRGRGGASTTPRTRSPSCRRHRTAPPRGSPRAISPRSGRRAACSGALPPRRRGAPGLPVLRGRRCSTVANKLLPARRRIVLVALLVVAVIAGKAGSWRRSVRLLGRPELGMQHRTRALQREPAARLRSAGRAVVRRETA